MKVYLTEKSLIQFSQQLKTFKQEVLMLPSWDVLPFENKSPNPPVFGQWAKTLKSITSSKIILISPTAFLTKISLDSLVEPLALKIHEQFDRELLIEYLNDAGYTLTDIVQRAGEYAVRGNLIDIFPSTEKYPIRLDYFSDEIESIRLFNVLTQRTIENINEITLYQACAFTLSDERIQTFKRRFGSFFDYTAHEYLTRIEQKICFPGYEFLMPLFFEKLESISSYFPKDTQYFLDENVDLEKTFQKVCEFHNRYSTHKLVVPIESLYEIPKNITFKTLPQENKYKISSYEIPNPNKSVIIGFDSKTSRAQLCKNIDYKIIQEDYWPEFPKKGCIYGLVYPIDKGFENDNYIIFSENDLFGKKAKPKNRLTYDLFQKNFDLLKGDYVVHREHGIGQFENLEIIEVNGIRHECIKVMYANNNRLFVPIEHFDLITRFGQSETDVILDQLGTLGWQKRKAKTKERINEITKRIIAIAAARKFLQIEPIYTDQITYERFCEGFPYNETEDQKQAIEDTLSDLASGQIMDRLICGDAGFGKTEVAMRAAFAIVNSGKQVAILVPTTPLCTQHFNSFERRFKNFQVEQISRLIPQAQIKKTIENIKQGKTNIIVGTHALLSDKIQFADLGLVVIDEEHRFGVSQKEKIKNNYKKVHMLALSATPIPRTLQLSFSGIKDMSLISAPPIDRISIRTSVGYIDNVRLQEIINYEYKRGGQVFYVTPRVKNINSIVERLQVLVPDKRIGIVHGQMNPSDIDRVMIHFVKAHFDILVCTNIIESGIDIPTANTIIIDDAYKFGLAQLYQLRGRVGRSNIQAFTYLTYPNTMNLTNEAKRRLEVMQNLDKLGIGLTIASQDMDIRGYGNVIGEEQSGHIRDVGVELYQHLLEEVLQQTTSEKEVIEDWSPEINLNLPVFIPELYIPDTSVRLTLYKEAAQLKDLKEINQFSIELQDRFGPIPKEVQNLLDIIELKNICKKSNISKINLTKKGVYIQFYKNQLPITSKMEEIMRTPWANKNLEITPQGKLLLKNSDLKIIKGLCSNIK